MPLTRFYLALLCAVLLTLTAACGDDTPTTDKPSPEDPSGTETDTTPVVEPPEATPQSPALDYLKENTAQLEAAVRHAVFLQAALPVLKSTAEKRVRRDPYQYRKALQAIYGAPEATFFFIGDSALNEDGDATVLILSDAYNHGLGRRVFHFPKLKDNIKALAERREQVDKKLALSFTEGDLETLADLMRDNAIASGDSDALPRLAALLLSDDSPLPHLTEGASAWKDAAKSFIKLAVEVELMITDGVARYAWEMRFLNKHWFDPELFKKKNTTQQRRALQSLMRTTLAQQLPKGGVAAYLNSLEPPHDQYKKLITSLKTYRAILDAGGWERPPRASLRKGSRGKTTLQLKQRLALEGFLPKDQELSNVYDDQTVEAVKTYQRTHQIKVTGKTDWVFWKSVRTSTEHRVEQIKLTLARWRESSITNDPYYVFVNIPDFHAETWSTADGALKRDMRFRIVVGNKAYGCDERDKLWKRINATPIQKNAIRRVIVNPYWNVPERIRKEEIIPLSKEDPTYFKRNGYECMDHDGDECVRVRQASGKENALGRVKFIFPNKHNTYMHDTPKKNFFKYPVRAFSHGCMRVQDPLDFAQYLLKMDKQWDEDEFQNRLDRKEEFVFPLTTHVPIHIEYYTVRVDDEGYTHFLSDIYRYDDARMEGREIEFRRCSDEELAYAIDPSEDDGEEDEDSLEEGSEGATEDTDEDKKDDKEEDSPTLRVITPKLDQEKIKTITPSPSTSGGLKLRKITIPSD